LSVFAQRWFTTRAATFELKSPYLQRKTAIRFSFEWFRSSNFAYFPSNSRE